MKTEETKIEELKVGEIYNVRVKVKTIGDEFIQVNPILRGVVLSTYWPTTFVLGEASAFSPIPPENGTKNSEPAPKYAPCRRFRKGDKVEYHPKDGRELFEAKRLLAQTLTVVENEHKEYNRVTVEAQNGDTLSVPFYYLKLVTPVEELERYILIHKEHEKCFEVCRKDDDEPDGLTGRTRCLATYSYHRPPQTYTKAQAKERAEAECARLNVEYRKEQQ